MGLLFGVRPKGRSRGLADLERDGLVVGRGSRPVGSGKAADDPQPPKLSLGSTTSSSSPAFSTPAR